VTTHDDVFPRKILVIQSVKTFSIIEVRPTLTGFVSGRRGRTRVL